MTLMLGCCFFLSFLQTFVSFTSPKMLTYDVAPTVMPTYAIAQPAFVSAPNYALEYHEKVFIDPDRFVLALHRTAALRSCSQDPWVVAARRQERLLDYPREAQLKEYVCKASPFLVL